MKKALLHIYGVRLIYNVVNVCICHINYCFINIFVNNLLHTVVSDFQKLKDHSKDGMIVMLRSRSDRWSFFLWRLGSGSRSQFLIKIRIAIAFLAIVVMPWTSRTNFGRNGVLPSWYDHYTITVLFHRELLARIYSVHVFPKKL